jgi:hypothetical protein
MVLAVITMIGLALHWPQLNTLVWTSDEGIHLSAAYLVNGGGEPYRQVSFSQGPFFLEMMRWPLQWGGVLGADVEAVRLTMLGFGVLQLIAVALIGRMLSGNLAGWIAAAALLAMPSFFYFARSAMADGPAIALGLWAAWAAIHYWRSGRLRWLLLSGWLLGLSLATKFLTIYALAWIGLLILQRNWISEHPVQITRRLRNTLRDGLLFGGAALLTVLTIYLWYDLPALFASAFGMRVAMREAFGSWAANNRDEIAEFWQYHAPFLVLAGYGLLSQRRNHQQLFVLGTWFTLIIVSLRVQNPLYHQHLQLLLPVVALLAGLGVAALVTQIRTLRSRALSLPSAAATAIGLILVSWLLVFTATAYRGENRYTEVSRTGLRAGQESLAEFLQKFTAPTDCVVTDDLNLAFITRRFPPPRLIDLSNARLATDVISDNRLEMVTERAGCQAVAALTERIFEFSPGFADWSAVNFLGAWDGEDEATVWLGQPLTDPQPALPLNVNLNDQVVLRGADLAIDQTRQTLYVSLYWQSLQPFAVDYKIFVHLRDGANTTLVNGDHLPYDNLVPTTVWPVDRTVKETIALPLPPNLDLAATQLYIGLYDPVTQARLPVAGDSSGENAVMLPLAGL